MTQITLSFLTMMTCCASLQAVEFSLIPPKGGVNTPTIHPMLFNPGPPGHAQPPMSIIPGIGITIPAPSTVDHGGGRSGPGSAKGNHSHWSAIGLI